MGKLGAAMSPNPEVKDSAFAGCRRVRFDRARPLDVGALDAFLKAQVPSLHGDLEFVSFLVGPRI